MFVLVDVKNEITNNDKQKIFAFFCNFRNCLCANFVHYGVCSALN